MMCLNSHQHFLKYAPATFKAVAPGQLNMLQPIINTHEHLNQPIFPRPPVRPPALPTHVYSRDYRAGLIAPDFNMEEVDMIFLDKSERFLEQQVTENPSKPIREFTLQQTISLALAIREGKWKYLDHKGSGGNRYDTPDLAPYALEEKSPAAPGQLYDLEQDPGETNNLYFEHPEVVKRLKGKLDQAKKSGRSVPQPNTIPQTK